MIETAAEALSRSDDCEMSTLKTALRSELELHDPNIVKVITDHQNRALYFSRQPLPFRPEPCGASGDAGKKAGGDPSLKGYFKHIGLYCYRKRFLQKFAGMKQGFLEKTEKLEQLRVLENGYRIVVALTKQESHGVDTPEDLEKVIGLLKATDAKEK
jgi:3-deoxy-manno-octulosonate cytidylyltransferase (CMP-KDO synthetase)